MYKIRYLENANKDIEDIFSYIGEKLNNYSAAMKLLKEFEKADRDILTFPHGILKYNKKYKYYVHKVKNYNIFYTIHESEKIIFVVRVLYKKRNYQNILN